jgi:spermidine synthase
MHGDRDLHRRTRRNAALTAAVLAAAASDATAMDVLHRERSLYRNIVVYEDDGLRCMAFGRNVNMRQSCTSLTEPAHLVFNYAKLVLGAFYLVPAPRRILVVGMGGGSLVMAMQRMYPGVAIDAVEIDPAVVRMSREYFGFVPADATKVYEEDGRVFVKRMQRAGVKYDLVVLDAYDHEYIPEHMLTVEFLQEVKSLLTERGVVAGNTFTSSRLYNSESATYYAAFGDFFALRTNNRVIIVRLGGLPDKAEIARNADALDAKLRPLGVDKTWVLPYFEIERGWPADTRVLTDQYSPSNLLNVVK